MEALIKAIVDIYNTLPPWAKTGIEVYFIPLFFIWLCVEGMKTAYKKGTTKKLDWRILVFGPWLIGAGWVLYHDLRSSVLTGTSIRPIVYFLDVLGGVGLGLASNLTSIIFEMIFNKFKKAEKKDGPKQAG